MKSSAVLIRVRNFLLLTAVFTATAGAQAQVASPKAEPKKPGLCEKPAAQPSPTPSLERRLFKNFLCDQKAIWTSPFHTDADDARWLVPLGLTTAALIATDRHTAGSLHNDRLRLNASRDVSYSGAVYTTATLAGAGYLIGRWSNNKRLRETGLLGGEALADSILVDFAFKEITQRQRPREGDGHGRFFKGGASFPSGHSTSAWSFATVVAHEYSDRPLIRWGAYGMAGLVSISRFTGRNHFLSDILVGSALGFGVGHYVYKTHHEQEEGATDGSSPDKHHSKLFPVVAPIYDRAARTYGGALAWSF